MLEEKSLENIILQINPKSILSEEKTDYNVKFPKATADITEALYFVLDIYERIKEEKLRELEKFREAYPNLEQEIGNINSDEIAKRILKQYSQESQEEKTLTELKKTVVDEITDLVNNVFSAKSEENNITKTITTKRKNSTEERYFSLEAEFMIAYYQAELTKIFLLGLQNYEMEREGYYNSIDERVPSTRIFYFKKDAVEKSPELEIAITTYKRNLLTILNEGIKKIEEEKEKMKETLTKHNSGLNNSKYERLNKIYFSLLQVERYLSKKVN